MMWRTYLGYMLVYGVLTVSARPFDGLQAIASGTKSGAAGHALLFKNTVTFAEGLKGIPTKGLTELTFEAWVSTSDFCHKGTLFSFARKVVDVDGATRTRILTLDVQANPPLQDRSAEDVMASHSKEHMEEMNFQKIGQAPLLASSDGAWRHIAVTWDQADNGRISLYVDGTLVSSSMGNKLEPITANGLFMLGKRQACYGGCTSSRTSFNGLMDEVRLWGVARSQSQIIQTMRWSEGLEKYSDTLLGYWRFNEPGGAASSHGRYPLARDSSGSGNDLVLSRAPDKLEVEIPMQTSVAKAGAVTFHDNYGQGFVGGMPTGDFTVEFWVRSHKTATASDVSNTFFSYACMKPEGSRAAQLAYYSDAIRIERLRSSHYGSGSSDVIRVHVNSEQNTKQSKWASDRSSHATFQATWSEDTWHHVAVAWQRGSGQTSVFVDGQTLALLERVDHGVRLRDGQAVIAMGSLRQDDKGSLTLGMAQGCLGGCHDPSTSANADMALVRVWNRALSEAEIQDNRWSVAPANQNGLGVNFRFAEEDVAWPHGHAPGPAGVSAVYTVRSAAAGSTSKLTMAAEAPIFYLSTAPLTHNDGMPGVEATSGPADRALSLNDQQVVVLPTFQDFPSTAITVEFWMRSSDGCNFGTPFSYATAPHNQQADNMFTIYNYNNLQVQVHQQGAAKDVNDQLSGLSFTNGHWHHVAVTWSSTDGNVTVYHNGAPVWQVQRAKGLSLPSGGTLVIGREQDCPGGCFNSLGGARGNVSEEKLVVPQDFIGDIDDVRIWKVARSGDDIYTSMLADLTSGRPSGFPGVDPKHPDLVAYWDFDQARDYLVEDVTGHGHDLQLMYKPIWAETEERGQCGNGVLEKGEECDDGNVEAGDGCGASCKIEHGFKCGGSPSFCRTRGSAQALNAGLGTGQQPKGSVRWYGVLLLIVVAFCCAAILLYIGWKQRAELAEILPQYAKPSAPGGIWQFWFSKPQGFHPLPSGPDTQLPERELQIPIAAVLGTDSHHTGPENRHSPRWLDYRPTLQ